MTAAPAARRNRGGCGPAARQRRDGPRTRRGRRGGWRLGVLRGRFRLGRRSQRGDAHDGRPNRRRGAQRGRRQPRCERTRGDARRGRQPWPARCHDPVSTARQHRAAAATPRSAPAGALRSPASVCQRGAAAQRAWQPLRRAGHSRTAASAAGAAQRAVRRQTRQARKRQGQAAGSHCAGGLIAARCALDGAILVCIHPGRADRRFCVPRPLSGAPAAFAARRLQAPAGAALATRAMVRRVPPAAARR